MTEFSDSTLSKADDLVKDGKVRQDEEHPQVWWVESPTRTYRVQAIRNSQTGRIDLVSCTCPNGTRRSQPTCYHVAGVLTMIDNNEQEQ